MQTVSRKLTIFRANIFKIKQNVINGAFWAHSATYSTRYLLMYPRFFSYSNQVYKNVFFIYRIMREIIIP